MSRHVPLLVLAALLSAASGCGGKKGTLTIALVTPLDVDPFASAAKVHLVVGNPAFAEQTAVVTGGHFTLDLSFKPPDTTLVGPVLLEALDAGGQVVARGKSPDLAFVPLDETLTVWVAPVGRTAVLGSTLARPRSGALATLLPGLGALFIGGTTAGDGGASGGTDVELWNAYTLTSTAVTSIPAARPGGIAIPVGRSSSVGTVLLAGGGVEQALLGFDTSSATGSWVQLGTDASLARHLAGATALADGTTLIAGGQGAGDAPLDTATVLTTSGSTTVTPVAAKMATARWGHTVTAAKVPGGDGAVVIGGSPLGAGVELYAGAARTFSPSAIDAKALPSSGHTATALSSGKVLVLGGLDAKGGHALADGAVVDAAAGSATALAGLLSKPRRLHTATLVGTSVLVCGGLDDAGAALDTCDVLDVSGDVPKRAKTVQMAAGRVGHSAVLLPQGTVLIAGGGAGAAMATVEIYTP